MAVAEHTSSPPAPTSVPDELAHPAPAFPSLYWPFTSDGNELNGFYLYSALDMWRFTVIWTMIFYGTIFLSAGFWAWSVFYRRPWGPCIPLVYVAVGVFFALVSSTIIGFSLAAVYTAASFRMSTWIPFFWAVIQLLTVVMTSYTSITTGL